MSGEIVKTNSFTTKPMTVNEPIKVANQVELKVLNLTICFAPKKNSKLMNLLMRGNFITSNVEASSINFETKDIKKILSLYFKLHLINYLKI